jgi:hypothetical protein
VLRAILGAITDLLDTKSYSNIRVDSLAKDVFQTHRVPLQSRQVAGIARGLRFTVKQSHGYTVVVPTPRTLLAACEECGYEDDEAVAELKRHVLGITSG